MKPKSVFSLANEPLQLPSVIGVVKLAAKASVSFFTWSLHLSFGLPLSLVVSGFPLDLFNPDSNLSIKRADTGEVREK